jgi:hypothetical protein
VTAAVALYRVGKLLVLWYAAAAGMAGRLEEATHALSQAKSLQPSLSVEWVGESTIRSSARATARSISKVFPPPTSKSALDEAFAPRRSDPSPARGIGEDATSKSD